MPSIEEMIRLAVPDSPCCKTWTARVENLAQRERLFFSNFMPVAMTAIVLGHHVVTEEEWTWHAVDDGGECCSADDHARDVCQRIRTELEQNGFTTKIVPYPRESGLQFRFVAQSAGTGKIGANAFLLHPQWGPWIHLRILATLAPTETKAPDHASVCNDCGACISACPAGAIQSGTFDGLKCRCYRKAKGEYTPVGPQNELRYCKICAGVCPIGNKPRARVGGVERVAPPDRR